MEAYYGNADALLNDGLEAVASGNCNKAFIIAREVQKNHASRFNINGTTAKQCHEAVILELWARSEALRQG